MEPQDLAFLRGFFAAVHSSPLEPHDPRYVHLYEMDSLLADDPVELLARGIEWTPGRSVQLFSGFRGTGKSTELRRLRHRLQSSGFLVVLCDIEDYVNLSVPIDIADFLIVLAGAFGDSLASPELLGEDAGQETYWDRLVHFLRRTRVQIDEVSLEAGEGVSLGLKAAFKTDPSFKRRIQEALEGHIGALARDVQEYVLACVAALKRRHGPEREVVFILDSLERLRGTSLNATEVHRSAEELFGNHADRLQLFDLHVVYTVPPYLKVRVPNLGTLYAPGGLHMLPAVKVRSRDGQPWLKGLDALERVVRSRGDWERLLGGRSALDRIALLSGGHLRDLLRILAEVLRRAQQVPVGESAIDAAIHQIRNEFLPIADADALWLRRVAATHRASLSEAAHLPDLARFFDSHLVLSYRNGEEWFDIHPLVADEVAQQVAELPPANGEVVAASPAAVPNPSD